MRIRYLFSKKEKKHRAFVLERMMFSSYVLRVADKGQPSEWKNFQDFLETYGRNIRFGKTKRLSPKRKNMLLGLWSYSHKIGSLVRS